jgi:hypothetical protein
MDGLINRLYLTVNEGFVFFNLSKESEGIFKFVALFC